MLLDRTAVPYRVAPAVVCTAFAFLVVMMGTTLPTPLYSIYSAQLGFSSLTVTVLFAVYALGVVAALTVFGRLSDEIGRRPVLLVAVALAILSAMLFLLPPSLPLLIVARIVSGLGAGLMSGTGTAAVIDLFAPEGRAAAGTLAVAVNTGGLAAGTLLAGFVADVSSSPLVVPFVVHLALALLAGAGLWAFAPRTAIAGRMRLRPRRLRVPSEIHGAFVRAVLAAGSAFAVTGVLTAVAAIFLARFLHLSSHALAGFVVFLAFAGMAIGQLVARRFPPRRALVLGCGGLVVAAGLLAVALAANSLVALLLSAAVLGLCGGLCMNAGIATTVEQVPPEHRAEVSSSFFAGLYVMLAFPAIGVGALSAVVGLRTAGLVFCVVVGILAASVCAVEARSASRARTLAVRV
ncbi:MFS transporter [Tsukamurella pulmonis]|uniref:Predicted arabinose efflux permease, MFS family n=1 Tax=Tsukamurella pulmonis TaxID=47312 RepID=A0A1H1DVH0_9ACTN|nr:MFS transporter [Tsukamurella pulmonis]KXO92194.1 MFS transporter [Tsukamurella pulmonis]SDQ80228.1 Predicted arabinose efflux permease, MFS family [Tsukamurella pulmonis]SUP21655.1 multidrug efflux system protein MdtL [Tsukamurella pulmonis]